MQLLQRRNELCVFDSGLFALRLALISAVPKAKKEFTCFLHAEPYDVNRYGASVSFESAPWDSLV